MSTKYQNIKNKHEFANGQTDRQTEDRTQGV